MTATVDTLYEEAMRLPRDFRLELAERLITGADLAEDLLREQTAAARKRMEDLDAGHSSEISSGEAERRLAEIVSRSA